jgi:5'-nucleotidase / UDP-sugar diphosphatase
VLGMPGDLYVPGDHTAIQDTYPFWVDDADDIATPVVTTAGDYKYLGRLRTRFAEDNTLTGVDELRSRMLRVAGGGFPDAVAADTFVQRNVVEPIKAYIADLADNVIAQSEVRLDGRNPDPIRLTESNLGNLMADSQLWAGRELAAEYGARSPDVAIQNGGGIRNNNLLPPTAPGSITELDTYSIAPFPNFLAVQEVGGQELKDLLENGYRALPAANGRFAQIAGMTVEVDVAARAQEQGEGDAITVAGERVRSVVLDDGTVVVQDGAVVVDASWTVGVAVSDFLARGGDNYPFRDTDDFSVLGISYQRTLYRYIVEGLGGQITAADYPEDPGDAAGRILIRNRPAQ